ncbi:hypothetical protein CMZ82_09620 [Lysobacteraceae bacterium NML93-0792]|nr:hypothetical protein CMZ82_09620 [Xanthomonadaceae bacterium NML93-0792]PBS15952.1 hypothetical protein CMZ81_08440 [Xanthomonadaceae bacterium NML93-0793]PBS18867.1 hypothetical protein CMZ80_09155 [Xanthomonadaceae bacterium NML93-0831]
MSDLTEDDVARLLALPRPDTAAMVDLDEATRKAIENRVTALVALIEGEPIKRVSKLYGLHVRTCKRMLELANEPAQNGGVHGFAVCLPHVRLVDPKPRTNDVPVLKRAYCMTQLVEAVPELKAALIKFRGALPSRRQTSPAFNRLFGEINRILTRAGRGENDYPRNTHDGGRRALASFIERLRTRTAEIAMNFVAEPTLTKWAELSTPEPFDEVQVDGHYIDLKDQWCAIPLSDGTHRPTRVSGLMLLAEIDVASRACMGWTVIVDDAHSQFDFLHTIKRALMPWRPKDMTGRRMQYLPNAWMPSAIDGPSPRGLRISVDNYSSHLAKHAKKALAHVRLGVYRFGHAGIPETRPHIEAFFKSIEVQVMRHLAGGFEPETKVRDEQKVSPQNSRAHPIFLHLLDDLLDIVFSKYNVTSHEGLQWRSPREVIEAYLADGGMPLRSSRTAEDVRDLGRFRVRVTIRGGNGELPHVTFGYATYRSEKLNTRQDLVGTTFNGYIEEDARFLVLLTETGQPYLELKTLPPYALKPHTLHERKRAHRWRKTRGQRWDGIDDLIDAFHAEVRDAARRLRWAADDVASGRVPKATPSEPTRSHAARTLEGFAPRGGVVSLRKR